MYNIGVLGFWGCEGANGTCSRATWAMEMPQPQPAAAEANAKNAGKSDACRAIHGCRTETKSPPPAGHQATG